MRTPMDCSTDNACITEGTAKTTFACLSDQGNNMTKEDQRVPQDVQKKLCSESAKNSALVLKINTFDKEDVPCTTFQNNNK